MIYIYIKGIWMLVIVSLSVVKVRYKVKLTEIT